MKQDEQVQAVIGKKGKTTDFNLTTFSTLTQNIVSFINIFIMFTGYF